MPVTITKPTILRREAAAGQGNQSISVVVSFSFDGSGNPVFSFSPDSVEMSYGDDVINFTLNTTTGYLFDNWFAPRAATGATFTPSLDATGTVLTVTDQNRNPTQQPVSIKYSLAVVNPNNRSQRYVSDPEIVNDPEEDK